MPGADRVAHADQRSGLCAGKGTDPVRRQHGGTGGERAGEEGLSGSVGGPGGRGGQVADHFRRTAGRRL